MGGTHAYVHDLLVYRDTLIAGGSFREAGGIAANQIAAWDGTEWSSMTGGIDDGLILAMTVYNDNLIAAGGYSVGENYIYQWDGAVWTILCPEGFGHGYLIDALTVHDNKLIAGGGFISICGLDASSIASWDGSEWSTLGSGIGGANAYVEDFYIENEELYVFGYFGMAGDKVSGYLAKWTKLDPICGDANGDRSVNIGDIVYITNYVFRNSECVTNPPIGCPPDNYETGDVNCDGNVNIGDAVYLGNYIFRPGSPEPCAECP